MALPKTITVTETIHHGDYYNVRVTTVPATWQGFVDLLTGSPYRGGDTAETLATDIYAAQTFASLLKTGRGEHGWATYTTAGTGV